MGFLESIGSGLANVAGGVVSNLINQNQQENEATRNQSNFNITQDNFLRNMQIRSADAKAAGLHPLYAMGAQAPGSAGSQPIVMQDQIGPSLQQAGQNMATSMARSQSPEQKLMDSLEIELRRSQIDETDARTAALNSEALRNMQAGQNGLGVQPESQGFIGPEGQAPNPPGTAMIEKKPAVVTSQMGGREDLVAGLSRAGFELRNMGKGFPAIWPVAEGESPMELWSEMSLYDKAGLINRNIGQFGPQWLDDFWDVMFAGKQVTGKYNTSDMSIKKHKGYLDYKLSPKINDILYGSKKYQSHEGKSIDPKTGRLK